MTLQNDTNYFKNIEFLRFVFCIVIVIFHLSRIGCVELYGYRFFERLSHNSDYMNRPVEFFFILAGFFLVLKFKNVSAMNFVLDKTIRLLPVILFTLLCFAVTSIFGWTKFYPIDNLFAIMFLNGIQIAQHTSPYGGLSNVHSSWYVSVYMCVSVLFFVIIRDFGMKAFNIIAFVISLLGLYWLSYNISVAIPVGTVRGLVYISIGCIGAQIYLKLKALVKTAAPSKSLRLIFTFVEVAVFVFFMFALCFKTLHHMVVTDIVLIFCILMALFIMKIGYFSRILENNLSVRLGSFSYSIFLTHNFVLDLLQKYWFTQEIYQKNVLNTTGIRKILMGGGGIWYCL